MLRASDRHRASMPAYESSYDYGFRVVQIPEPATLGLLLMGGLMAWRRRA